MPELVATETAAIVTNAAWSHTTTAEGVSGDVIGLLHFTQGGGGADMEEPTSPPGGWTMHPPPASEAGWAPAIEVWTRPAPTGTFTVTIPPVGVSGHQGVIFLLRDATETPEAVAISFGDSTAGHITPSVDADTDDALIVRGIATRGGDSNTYTWPASTERTDSAAGSGGSGGVFSTATKVATASGAQGTETCTGTAVSAWGEYIGITVSWGSAAGGTTYEQSVSGTVTPAGTVVRQTAKTLTASTGPAGALVRQANRILAGTITPTGTTAKTALLSMAGSLASSAALQRTTSKPVAGTVTPTGAITKQVSKTLAGALAPSGAVLKLLSRLLGGTVTPAGAVTSSISQLRDLVITYGPPQAKWTAGAPQPRWTYGPPQ